jgi:hypothetical protein
VQAGPGATQKQVPRRFRYAPTEYSINPTAINAAVSSMGGDTFNTKVWWDVPNKAPTFTTAAACGMP